MAAPKKDTAEVRGKTADLAIQPNVYSYERRKEDMGGGITRYTYYAEKENE